MYNFNRFYWKSSRFFKKCECKYVALNKNNISEYFKKYYPER